MQALRGRGIRAAALVTRAPLARASDHTDRGQICCEPCDTVCTPGPVDLLGAALERIQADYPSLRRRCSSAAVCSRAWSDTRMRGSARTALTSPVRSLRPSRSFARLHLDLQPVGLTVPFKRRDPEVRLVLAAHRRPPP